MIELQYPFDQGVLFKNKKSLKKALLADGTKRTKKKIAVLGGSTADHVIAMLELFLLDNGIEPVFYKSEYAKYYEDAVFGNPELDEFKPDLVYIHTSSRNINVPMPEMSDSSDVVNDKLKKVYDHFETVWRAISEKFGCAIIQNNFEPPMYRLLGNRDFYDIHGGVNFINRLNEKFAEYARTHEGFYINDINYMAASYGLREWSDPKYWYMYKYFLCLPAIPELAYNIANIIKSIYGKNKKAIALDLDNTLWGGIVGDDGVSGIQIGQENAEAESYHEFQTYLRRQKNLGVLLTVCSKNDHENAIAGLNHPEGVLRPDDFTVIKANWEDKAGNLRQTASELNIGADAIVFIDDNPAERTIVREYGNGVIVPEIGNPEEYMRTLDRCGFFEVTSFSEDDLKRGEMYKANAERAESEKSFTNYREYLLNLEMKADIKNFEEMYLPRITQLTNKSNQFNVTTKRYTENEIESISKDDTYIPIYGKLEDRFGDNGVVSVVIGKIKGENNDELHLDLWLMSCRVLKRDMELAMLDTLVQKAISRGIKKIFGYYRPTAKNNMVRGLFESFGFDKISCSEEETVWMLKTAGYEKKNSVICVTTD